MANKSGTLANVAIAIAAIAVAGSAIYGEFFRPRSQPGGIDPTAPPEYVEGWETLAQIGLRTGNASAPMQIVEFADLECPACARYESTIRAFMLRHPDSVSRVFVHYPLEMHRYSRRAAQALECATLQGAFDDMLVGLYGSQLDFSSNPWARLAEESGASDTTALRRCMTEESEHPRIARGKAVAEGLRLTGTPAVLVNGFLYPVSPKDSALERAFRAIQRGEDPPDARSSSTRKVEVEYLDRI